MVRQRVIVKAILSATGMLDLRILLSFRDQCREVASAIVHVFLMSYERRTRTERERQRQKEADAKHRREDRTND